MHLSYDKLWRNLHLSISPENYMSVCITTSLILPLCAKQSMVGQALASTTSRRCGFKPAFDVLSTAEFDRHTTKHAQQ